MLAKTLAQAQASWPVHVVIDATGLKVYGAGEWLVEKRGKWGWRKLHLAVDPESGEVLTSELTQRRERWVPGRSAARANPWPDRFCNGGWRL